MAQLLRMPAVAANANTAVLLSWSVVENTNYAADDTLAEVETDKAVVDIDAEADGILLKRLVPAGSEVEVGAPIALLGGTGDSPDDISSLLRELGVDSNAAGNSPTAVPDDPAEHAEATVGETLEADIPRTADDVVPTSPVDRPKADGSVNGSGEASSAAGQQRTFASPLARRLAADAELPIETLNGTGPGGRIRRTDVEAAISARAAAVQEAPPPKAPVSTPPAKAAPSVPEGKPTSAAHPTGEWVDEPHSRMRSLIAARLTASKATVPHFYLRSSIRVDKLLALRAELNSVTSSKISVNDLILKAAAHAYIAVPDMNVIWTDEAIRRFSRVDISVAVASERGLVTPTIRAVESLAIGALSDKVKRFVERANSGRLKQEELEGGALTISNLGMMGIEDFAAIINPPQSAILAVGAARPEAVVTDGRIEAVTILRVTLAVDHRAVDGALAAEWLRHFTKSIEAPLTLLT